MQNKFQIGKGIFGRTLKERDRHKHLLITPRSKEDTQRFWLKILQMEFSQPCSTIIVTRDINLVTEVERLLPKTKQVHYIDPDCQHTLSLNPLFHSTSSTSKWLTEFFVWDKEKSVKNIFRILTQIAITDTHSEKSLAYVFRLAGLGRLQLIEYLQFQGLPLFISARQQFKKLPIDEQERALQEIYGCLALLQTDYAQRVLSEQKFYAPILFHEPSVVIVYVSPGSKAKSLLLRLLVHSIVHQVIDASPKNDSGSIYLHLDGMDLVPSDYFLELQGSRVGTVCLADEWRSFATRSHFHIDIENSKKGSLSTLKTVKNFHPVMIPA